MDSSHKSPLGLLRLTLRNGELEYWGIGVMGYWSTGGGKLGYLKQSLERKAR
jgi:hypothetical protein